MFTSILSATELPWNIAFAKYISSGRVLSTSPRSMFLNADGTKCFVGFQTFVEEHNIPTAYNIASMASSADVRDSNFTGGGQNIATNNDGTIFYSTTNTVVYAYTLGTGFDLSTKTVSPSATFDASSQVIDMEAIVFGDSGSKLYLLDGRGNQIVYEYTLSTPYDISTASYSANSFDVSSQASNATGIRFKPDGTRMFICDTDTPDGIYQYELAVAWDVSSAVYSTVSFDVSGQASNPFGMEFKPDGLRFYIVDDANDAIFQYDIG